MKYRGALIEHEDDVSVSCPLSAADPQVFRAGADTLRHC
jgi:hypothetical protein